MKDFLLVLCILFISITCFAQSNSDQVIKPILVDKSAISGVGLKKIDLKDEPEKDFHQRNLFWGKEIGVFVVSTESWVNKIDDYPFDEFVYMYHGEAIVKPKVGPADVFYSGEYFFAPKGFAGEWEIKANNSTHYELSVITTTRADSSVVSNTLNHKRFDKSLLSGNGIKLDEQGMYEEALQVGAELTIKMAAEEPTKKLLETQTNERMIHLLSGQLEVTDADGKQHMFYTGDFFIFPKGLSGGWKSDGHGLVKYLIVEKT